MCLYELCQCIRSDPQMRDTKTSLMTAFDQYTMADCDADACLRKPLDSVALVELIRGHLD